MNKPSRLLAFEALRAVLLKEPARSLSDVLASLKMESDDPAFLQSLCYGVCRYHNQLQITAKRLLNKPIKDKDYDVLLLIEIGIFQLHFLRVPDHAAINETVKLVSKINKPWAKGWVNAVLRNFQRNPELATKKEQEKYAHPKWLINSLKQDWPEHWQTVVEANNEHPPFCIRVNANKISRESYLELLEAQGIAANACEFSPVGIRLNEAIDVYELPNFADGWVSVQDEAAQLTASLIDKAFNEPDCRVLDACSAPGGKTTHLLEHLPQLGELVATDLESERLQRVQENLTRHQSQATLLAADILQPDYATLVKAPFDAILLDAPCSGAGVIRRHPDIKWLRQEQDIANLAQQQYRMLNVLWDMLKPNGQLLYSTCSVMRDENDRLMQKFLDKNDDVRLETLPASWGVPCEIGRQFLPQAQQPDGFYLCLLRKQGS